MTVHDPLHDWLAHPELSGERSQTLSRLAALAAILCSDAASPTNLVCLLTRQLRVHAPLLVDVLCHRFHVLRVDAVAVPTEMVDLAISRDLLDEPLVEVAMSRGKALPITIPNRAVALRVSSPNERPAGGFVAALLHHIPLFKRYGETTVNPSVVSTDETARITLLVAVASARVDPGVRAAAAFAKCHVPTLHPALEAARASI